MPVDRLDIRCDPLARELLERAASYTQTSVSEFVLGHALAAAEQVVEKHEAVTLIPDDFRAFLAALDALAEPNQALQDAFRRHAERVR